MFLFNGYADWEPSLIIAGLNKFSDFEIESFSVNGSPVVSMGGLNIHPGHSLNEIDPDHFDLLILPGGDEWEKGGNREIIPLLEASVSAGKKVAAICAATTILAHCGFLDNISHTSNGLKYLKKICPGYKGSDFYINKPCIAAGNFITAGGAAMIEFAYEIYKTFDIFDENILEAVKDMYKSGGMDNRLMVE